MPQVSKRQHAALWLAMLVLLVTPCSAQAAAQDSQPWSAQQDVQSSGAQPPARETKQELNREIKEEAMPETNAALAVDSPAMSSPQEQQPPDAVKKQADKNQPDEAADQQDSGLYVFKAEVDEVVLHATVLDEHHRLVTNLDRDAFKIFDDGRRQQIHSFRRDDVPVALAIVIDNSGSMRDKRPALNAAALNLVRASNPQDQVCVVNFNNEYYLDQDYTGDIGLLREALEHIESRGGTALYDALVATSGHLMKSAKLQKKAILVVTDGQDTASRNNLQQAVRSIAVDGGPVVYGIGLLGHDSDKRAHRALRILAEQTGGVSFFPAGLSEVEAISQQIAHDIRNQYTIGYIPSPTESGGKKAKSATKSATQSATQSANQSADSAIKPLGGYHQVVVKAEARGYKGLSVRTRSGYYVNDGQASLGPR